MAPPLRKRRRRQVTASSDTEESASGLLGLPDTSREQTSVSVTSSCDPSAGGPKPLTLNTRRSKSSTLHSFFNSRIQAQSNKSSQSSNEALKVDGARPNVEDDIEEVGTTATPLKRKFGQNARGVSLPSGAEPRSTESSISRTSSKDNLTAQALPKRLDNSARIRHSDGESLPWSDQFPPISREELAVHKTKVEEVDKWLNDALANHPYRRILVLRGPAGCGKTATVSVLAKNRGVSIIEWKNPTRNVHGDEGYLSASLQFQDFLVNSGQFPALSTVDKETHSSFDKKNGSWTSFSLIEEFTLSSKQSIKALSMFRASIALHIATTHARPAVIIVTEDKASFEEIPGSLTAYQLLGPELIQHPAIAMIDFNPIAPTFMLRALLLILEKEAQGSGVRKNPKSAILSAVSDSGDIRSAIGTLQTIYRSEGIDSIPLTSTKVRRSARAKEILTPSEEIILQAITRREANVGLFHAVGKVVYNKRDGDATDYPPTFLSSHIRPKASMVDVDELYSSMSTDVDTLVAALHENYIQSCSSEDPLLTVDNCMEALSYSDVLGSFEYGAFSGYRGSNSGTSLDMTRHGEMIFQQAVRGLLFSLPYPVNRKQAGENDFHKMLYPASLRIRKQQSEVQSEITRLLDRYVSRVDFEDLLVSRLPKFVGVESWASTVVIAGDQRSSAHHSGANNLRLPLNKCSHGEAVEFYLPYVHMIKDARSQEPPHLILQALNNSAFLPTDAQARFFPSQTTLENLPTAMSTENDLCPQNMESQKLVLSDDDIEDC